MLPIGLQLYSVRDAAEKDLESVLKSVKDFGYDGVELAGLYGKTPQEIKKLLDDIGLIPISAHVGIYEMRTDMEKVIHDYKTIGCKYIVIPWLSSEDRMESENADRAVEEITRFAEMALKADIPLCYHNHDFEFVKINGEYAFDILYKKVPNLLVQQDSCWVKVGGESPVEYLKKYSGRTHLLHLKDFVGSKSENNLELRPVGYGVQDFKSIIATANDCGVKWLIVEQDSPSMDKTSLECAKLSIDYIKEVIK